jgi:hypothetical protein
MTGYPYADAAGQAAQGLADKLTALGEPLLVVAIVVGALLLMFSAQLGKRILLYAAIGGFLLLGGWKLVVELIKYLLQ